jgi:hypothetical protein
MRALRAGSPGREDMGPGGPAQRSGRGALQRRSRRPRPGGGAILKEKGLDADVIDAIRMHNEKAAGAARSTEFQHGAGRGRDRHGPHHRHRDGLPRQKGRLREGKVGCEAHEGKAFAAS